MKSFPAKTTYRLNQQTTVKDTGTGLIYTTANTSVDRDVYVNLKQGAKDPNWKVKVRKKQDATLGYTLKFATVTPAVLVSRVETPYVSGPMKAKYVSNDFLRYAPPTSLLISDLDDNDLKDRALGTLRKRLNRKVGLYNAVVPVAELRELRQSITGATQATLGTVTSIMEIRRKYSLQVTGTGKAAITVAAAKLARKNIQDAWLTWSFGIKPLIADIDRANEAISKFLTREDSQERITGTAIKSWLSRYYDPSLTGAYNASNDFTGEVAHRLSYKYIGVFDLKVKSSNNYGVADTFGLDMSGLISTGYELFPYSWLIDYFTNLGAYLDDTFVLPPGSLLRLQVTQMYKMECMFYGRTRVNPGASLGFMRSTRGEHHYVHFQRTKLDNLPTPGLRFRSFDEIGKNATNKLCNLLALLRPASAKDAISIREEQYHRARRLAYS